MNKKFDIEIRTQKISPFSQIYGIKKFFKLGLSIFSICFATNAHAMLIEWGGTFRSEWINVGSTSLGSPKNDKSYILNGFLLRPKIVASDGFEVLGELNLLPNSDYPDAQTGALLGQSPSKDRTVDGGVQGSSEVSVRQLYLSHSQEYASLIVGRAPVEFGLGMTHNPGTGLFDHFGDTLDQISYKFLVNNWSFTPMIGKRKKLNPGTGGEASELNFVLDYKSPETKSEFGVFQQTRKASLSVNDAPAYNSVTQPNGYGKVGDTHSRDGEWSTTTTSFYLTRGFEAWSIQLEAGFESGDVGVTNTTSGEKVSLGGFGLLLNLDFGKPESTSLWNVKIGYASGDDPSTTKYEGFSYDKNMDVALLLFNHPLGQYDVLRSGVKRTPTGGNPTVLAQGVALDDESLTNAIFISPTWTKVLSDKWKFSNRLTWAQLAVDPNPSNGVSKDLGFEYDVGFHYSPKKEILWATELAFLSPGGAFAGGSAGFEKAFTYGLMSRFSISF